MRVRYNTNGCAPGSFVDGRQVVPPEGEIEYVELGMLESALEDCLEPVEIRQLDGRIEFVNRAWSRLFERDGTEVKGLNWDSLDLSDVDSSELRASWARCIALGRSEGQLRRKRGDRTDVVAAYTRFRCKSLGGPGAAAITVYSTSTFPTGDNDASGPPDVAPATPSVGVMEHRLRNLLTVIVANTEFLERTVEDRALRARLSLIRSAARGGVDILTSWNA